MSHNEYKNQMDYDSQTIRRQWCNLCRSCHEMPRCEFVALPRSEGGHIPDWCYREEEEECSECEGKCKSNEKEKCDDCGIELRIGCANNPSDHSIFDGCCDDCREVEEETICEDCEVKNAESFSYYMNRCSDCCYKREMSNREYDKQKAILGR